MVSMEEYGKFETAWCPGCGNHAILACLKQALAELELAPHQVCIVSGIGQAAKTPQYMNCNMFNGLHGRALPVAQGVKLANPELAVVAVSGDGCSYGEGGNHFLAALRRNVNMTLIAHDNQIYGLTKGQASPTTARGQATKAQPGGSPSEPLNPVALAVTMKAGFVARAFSGEKDHLVTMIKQAICHPGFALVDVLQPCVSFNKVNTFAWYRERCYKLGEDHNSADWDAAMTVAMEFDERIPIGILYRNSRAPFGSGMPGLEKGPLALRSVNREELVSILAGFE
ncbi:2-oxoacid:ferredoxin oxidoreductase subunit beta [Pseudodesulfovibrio tunisiensis]|uniref:2-oxoacid:ferredoxin oxidoreductase subunit beta n=1 Tax=Pseudodesulfovibrio tunisiensis TaxID=463192 RepID=UPI001FB487BB|nr:2-oxoacid:ferredoxin oxidoreductase subunit beta [Pseudodesulfovibrio tunisiensis]